MILPIFKPIGASSHQLAYTVGKQFNQKATHTGTLDPMADGVMIILTGNDRFNKSNYSSWTKKYQFKVLIGISTDSNDLLGKIQSYENTFTIIKNTSMLNDNIKKVSKAFEYTLPGFVGEQSQQLPKFSAKRIQGESYFDKAKRNERFYRESQYINIDMIRLIKFNSITNIELDQYIKKTISKIHGSFRQIEIQKTWHSFLSKTKDGSCFLMAQLEVICSKKTYVRALVRDLSMHMSIPLTTFSITRTKNGPYSIADCTCLV